MIKLKFEIQGIVEKPDIIGAIFGQTEGLFGPELNLNELQKNWKIGRIEINLKSKNDKTMGEVYIPASTDMVTAALIAASIESVDKVGPFVAKFQLIEIEDVRAAKRKQIVERAKEIIKEWKSKASSEGEELVKEILEALRPSKLITYGPEQLPAGPGVYNSDLIILVEGRADVINLLRAGYENVLALDGARIPESVIKLSKSKKLVAFLDGDRGGDLIKKELSQVLKLEKIIRAPPGREVEELTPMEIREILERELKEIVELPQHFVEKVKEIYPSIKETLEAIMMDENFTQLARVPVSELVNSLENVKGTKYVIFDGIVTQRLIEASKKAGVEILVGYKIAEDITSSEGIKIVKFSDIGLS